MRIRTLTRFGLLASVALVLGYVEHMIPIAPTLPGIKLGIANTVLLYALYLMSQRGAFGLMLVKVLLSGALFAGFSGAMYSFAGGLLSLLAMMGAKKLPDVSIVGVSVVGAVFHNLGQIFIASLVVQNRALFAYFPALLISALVTGVLTGITAKYVIKGLSSAGPAGRS